MENNYQVSPNLIDQLQILLKKEAGIDSLNSIDYSIDVVDSLKSSYLNDAIVGSNSNSSVDVLRCRNCNGELLRGSESIICVYCGLAQNQDCIRHPISFKSTFAFQWFLQSLGLDGFENVGNQNEGTLSGDRGRRSFKEEEISLSDFLDLQLKWGSDDSKGFRVQNEEQLSGKNYLSLVGLDVEKILARDRRDHDPSSVGDEQVLASEKTENDKTRISGEGNLTLFENMQSSEAPSRFVEGDNNESFSDWGADFQSAIPGSGHVKSGNSSIFNSPSGSNLTTFNSRVSDGNSLGEGVGKAIESNFLFEGLAADQHLSKKDSLDGEKMDGVDSFEEWGDFSMSISNTITRSESSSTAVPGTDIRGELVMSKTFDGFIGPAVSKGTLCQDNTLRVPDDAWNTFITPGIGGDRNIHSQAISDEPEHVGTGNPALGGASGLTLLNGNQLQGKESSSIAPGATKLDDSFDLWNVLKGSDNKQQTTNTDVADNGISADPWNDFSILGVQKKDEQANSLEVVGGKGNDNQSDSLAFDSWGDFTRSGVISDSKPISNDISSGAWNDFSSLLVTNSNQPQSSNTKASENQATFDVDTLFSPWSDFRSSGTQAVNSVVGSLDDKSSSDPVSFHKDPNSLKMTEGTTISAWGDFEGATSSLDHQLQVGASGSSENKLNSGGGDLFSALSNSGKQSTDCPENQLQCDGVTILDGGSTFKNDDSFDNWSDFTSSSNAKENHSSSANAPDHNEAVKHSDIFNALGVVVNSPNVEAGKDTGVAMGFTSEFNLLGHNVNSLYVGSENLMQPDLSAAMFSDKNDSAPLPTTPYESRDMTRTEHVKADGYVDSTNPNESISKERVAETLISEMHDLSFMLESGLSIPNSGT